MDLIPLPSAGQANLADASSTLNYCKNYGGGATTNANWICQKDKTSGSIGYLSATQANTWQDAFSGKTAAICPPGNASTTSEWGWVPVAGEAGGGHSCHNAVSSADDRKNFCNTTQGRSMHSECDNVPGSPAAPASAQVPAPSANPTSPSPR